MVWKIDVLGTRTHDPLLRNVRVPKITAEGVVVHFTQFTARGQGAPITPSFISHTHTHTHTTFIIDVSCEFLKVYDITFVTQRLKSRWQSLNDSMTCEVNTKLALDSYRRTSVRQTDTEIRRHTRRETDRRTDRQADAPSGTEHALGYTHSTMLCYHNIKKRSLNTLGRDKSKPTRNRYNIINFVTHPCQQHDRVEGMRKWQQDAWSAMYTGIRWFVTILLYYSFEDYN